MGSEVYDQREALHEVRQKSRQVGFSAKISELEAEMSRLPQADCPVIHNFTPGLYIRTIKIPAGTLITSAEHRTAHPFVITRGKIRVGSENEGDVIYEAPFMGITQPGTKRLLYAIEDTEWTTFHVTDETDPIKIGEAILAPSVPRLEGWRGNSIEGGQS